jgi:hypothetical protein
MLGNDKGATQIIKNGFQNLKLERQRDEDDRAISQAR